MSQSSREKTIGDEPNIPIFFVTDSGTAEASANILNVLGIGGATTSGLGNTITIDATGAVGVSDIIATSPLTANGVSGSPETGSVTLAISGSGYVSSIAGTANQIAASASTGAVTLSLTNGISIGSYQATASPTGGIICPGSVGIGVLPANFADSLNIADTGPYGSSGIALLDSTDVKWTIRNITSDDSFRLGDASNYRFYILQGGNVGVSTGSPQNKLDVNGAVAVGTYAGVNTAPTNGMIVSGNCLIGATAAPFSANPKFLVFGGALGGSTGNLMDIGSFGVSDTNQTRISIYSQRFADGTDWTTDNIYFQRIVDITLQGYLRFGPNSLGLGGTSAETITINSSNLVGIGTTTPQNQLDIDGSVAIGTYAGSNSAPANGLIISGNVAIGTATPPSSSALTISSTTQAFLPPVMNNVQRDAIGSPTAGLVIYSSTDSDLEFYNGSSWIGSSSSGVTSLTGTANQVLVNGITGSPQTGALTLTLPQSIATTSSVQFGLVGVGQAAGVGAPLFVKTSSMSTDRSFFVAPALTFADGISLNSVNDINSLNKPFEFNGSIFNLRPGNVGIDTASPQNKLDVNGAVAIGTFAGVNTAPTNGMIVSGSVLVGSTTETVTNTKFEAFGGFSTFSYNTSSIPENFAGLAISWNKSGGGAETNFYNCFVGAPASFTFNQVTTSASADVQLMALRYVASTVRCGINQSNPLNQLDVSGSAAIGTYSGANTAPANGLIVSGNVSIGTASPPASAALTVSSTTQAFLPPVMNNTQRDAIGSPTAGLVIYSTTDSDLEFYNGSTWIASAGSGVTSISGTANQIAASASTGAVTLSLTNGISIGSYQATTPPSEGLICPGNVGIGTSAPGTTLAVNGSIQWGGGSSTAFGEGTLSSDVNWGAYLRGRGGVVADIALIPSGGGSTDGLFMVTGGNIVIGASASAAAKLNITDSTPDPTNYGQTLQITRATTGAGQYISFIRFGSNAVSLGYSPGTSIFGFGASNATDASFTPGNIAMDLANNRVGIATTSPQNRLDVNGPVAVGTYAGVNTAPTNGLIVSGSVGVGVGLSTLQDSLNIADTGSFGYSGIALFNSTAVKWTLRNITSDDSFRIGDTSAYRFYILQGGNVGISTGSPQNKLDVNGGMAIGTYAGVNTAPTNGMIVSGNVSIGTASPPASAALTVSSTTQAFLPPVMNNTQRDAIGSPTAGLVIYSTTDSDIEFYNGSNWIAAAGSGVTSISGTANQIAASASTGAVTLSLTNGISIGGYQATASPTGGIICPGSVGIGTSAPISVLHAFSGTSGAYFTNADFVNTSAGSGVYISTGAASGNTYTFIQAFTSGNTATGILSINRFGGNVGIATETPENSLDVNGSVAIGTFAGVDAAPNNGLIISGDTYIGANDASFATTPKFLVRAPDLGTTAGDLSDIAHLQADDDNVVLLDVYAYRSTTGSDHESNDQYIQRMIEGLEFGYVRFSSVGSTLSLSGNDSKSSPAVEIFFDNKVHINNGFMLNRAAAAGSYVMTGRESIIGVTNTSSVRTVTLLATVPPAGYILTIKDESGGASVNNIVIDPNGNDIDGSPGSILIAANYDFINLYSDGTNWFTY